MNEHDGRLVGAGPVRVDRPVRQAMAIHPEEALPGVHAMPYAGHSWARIMRLLELSGQ